MAVVEIEGVTKSYQSGEWVSKILTGVDLRLEQGDFAVLFGPSGSGKTTLLNLVAAIDSPDEGTVRVAQVDLTAATEKERTAFRRERVGYVFQFYNLLPTLTALENVQLSLELERKPSERAAREALERVGLAGKEDRFPAQLSGGEQQRVAIARALVKRPALLCGDEPTGNLDRATAAGVLSLLRELSQRDGLTVLLASHDPTMARAATRVIRLEDGRAVEQVRGPEAEGSA